MSDQNEESHIESVSHLVEQEDEAAALRYIPTLDHFEKTYGRSMQNDQKAVKVFRDYEPVEKVRRLQHELSYVRDGRVPLKTMRHIIGRKREAKYGGFNAWSSLMLQWINQRGTK